MGLLEGCVVVGVSACCWRSRYDVMTFIHTFSFLV